MIHRKKLIVASALCAAIGMPSGHAMAEGQKIVSAQFGFVSKQMGVPVEGQFKKFVTNIKFDPDKLADSKIMVTIETGSATLGSKETDAEIAKAPWFNSAAFPKATFESTSIKLVNKNNFEVAGKLNIKGNTSTVVVPLTLVQAYGVTTASGEFTIKRLAFKIGENEWADTSMVADDVQVKFKLGLSGVSKL